MLVRRTYLDHRHIASECSAAVKFLGFAQKDRNVVRVSCLDALADIGSDKECLMEEDSVKLGISVWSWPFRMKMMDAYILKFPPFSACAECIDKYAWRTCHTAQMNMVA